MLQQKRQNLPHLIADVHFFYKSVPLLTFSKVLFDISAFGISAWVCNRMSKSRESILLRQHILLPWQQLTNNLHHVEFEKNSPFVSKFFSKFLTLYLQDKWHLEIAYEEALMNN